MSELIIDSQKFKHNIELISKHIDKQKLAIVLKDNAYGHGLKEIASLAKENNISNVFVKNEYEALKVKDDFKNITSLYGSISPNTPKNIYATIHSQDSLSNLKSGRGIEIKVNTGMNRNGIEQEEIENVIDKALKAGLEIIGVFSHNGYGDSLGSEFEKQQDKFKQIKQEVIYLSQKMGFKTPRFHSLNSSGALRSENIDDDLCRIGIAVYGYLCSSLDLKIAQQLKPIASLWADKISQKELKSGDRIGYDGAGIIANNCVVSTYDIGYGDGLFRLNENNKNTLFSANGSRILPRMSMDCFSCESNEDRLCVFDDANHMAKVFDTISYEILTKLSPHIKKKII